MKQSKLSDLAISSSVDGEELLPLVLNNENFNTQLKNIKQLVTKESVNLANINNTKDIDKIVIKLLDCNLFSRLKEKPTLEELAILFGVTRERMRQIERQGISKLKNLWDKNNMLQDFIESIYIYKHEKQMEKQ